LDGEKGATMTTIPDRLVDQLEAAESAEEAVAILAGEPGADASLTAEQKRYLQGPIVAADQGWGQTIPDWLLRAIPRARLQRVIRELTGQAEGEKATLEEVVAYLYTASLSAPLNREAALVDFWVTAQVLAKYTAETPEGILDKLELSEGERGLTDHLRREVLERLRREIRRSVSRRR
jgi:hypothetical protein